MADSLMIAAAIAVASIALVVNSISGSMCVLWTDGRTATTCEQQVAGRQQRQDRPLASMKKKRIRHAAR